MSKGNRNRQRRRELPPTNPASHALRALDGARIPGGCDHCNAYQEVRADHYGTNLHAITIHHDDWCPWLTSRKDNTPEGTPA